MQSAAFAFDFFEVESEVKTKDPKKSHFNFIINASVYQFQPAYDFSAQAMNLTDRSVNALGTDLLFGWKQNIVGGMSLSLSVGGFFQRYTKNDQLKASPDLPEVISSFDERVHLFGAYGGGELGYLFDKKFAGVHIEPFVSTYVGRGKSSSKVNYSYDLTPLTEKYEAKIDEEFNFARVGFGFNFVSNQAWFARISMTRVTQDVVERSRDGFKNGVAFNNSTSSVPTQSFNIFSIGFGYQI